MTIDGRCAKKWFRRFGVRLGLRLARLLAVSISLTVAANPTWSQMATYPYTVLYKFPAPAPGYSNAAVGNLLVDPTGGLDGASLYGGESAQSCPAGCGEAFRLSHGKFTVLADLGSQGAAQPSSGLIRDRAGNLYGESASTVYEIDIKGNVTVLASFGTKPGADGFPEGVPTGGLTFDKAGNLIGSTSGSGGLDGQGEIFKVDLKGNKTILFDFDYNDQIQTAAYEANNGVVVDAAGNIYGTTSCGGDADLDNPCGGLLYKLSPDGTLTVLHSFTGEADGNFPEGIALDQKGNLFGFTSEGGLTKSNATGQGTIFEYDAKGNFTTLYTFTGAADGAYPVSAPLLYDSSIYGAADAGGATSSRCTQEGCGVVFRLSPSGVETVLHTFIGTDGSHPTSGLVKDSNYNLYGAAAFIYRVGMIPQTK